MRVISFDQVDVYCIHEIRADQQRTAKKNMCGPIGELQSSGRLRWHSTVAMMLDINLLE